METRKVYEKFLLKLDAVGTTNIAVDKGAFCYIFNEAQNKQVEFFLSNKTDDNIRYIQRLLTTEELTLKNNYNRLYTSFTLPSNYFEFSSASAIADSENCKGVSLDLFEIKNQNKDVILSDEFNSPSFLYRETPYYIGNQNINVYKDDSFEINRVILDYYRYPLQIRLIDEDNFESDFNENYQTEFDDRLVDRIISTAVSDLQISIKDGTFQVNRERGASKI